MPVIRKIARDSAQVNNRFSALVIGVVKSDLFRMTMAESPRPANGPVNVAVNR